MENKSAKDQNDLRSALEYQIDIVLRLEEERLLLLKENKVQKEKIRELVTKCNDLEIKKVVHKESKEHKEIQTIVLQTKDADTQADMPIPVVTEESNQSIKQEKLQKAEKVENPLISEANEYIKKYANLDESQRSIQSTTSTKKKTVQGKTTMRSSKPHEKENLGASLNEIEDKSNMSFIIGNLRQEKNILTEELINLNKEVSKLRTENRLLNENSKKSDKEKMEMKKSIQAKSELIDKLKKEASDMTEIINKDQFKTVRLIEGELRKMAGHNKDLITELEKTRQEKTRLEEELEEFKAQLDKLTEDVEIKFQEENEAAELKKEKVLREEKLSELEKAVHAKQEELFIKEKTIQEMATENNKLSNDIDYFKNVAMTSKTFAEKAIADIEVYRKMLESMQKKEALGKV